MAEAEILSIDGSHGTREVKLSSADKVLWPKVGRSAAITKRDLADYLLAVSGPFLRINGDRPMTLQRFPDGIEGEEFFAKRPPAGAPKWLNRVTCTYPSRRRHDQLTFDEPAALAWAAQMATITFHPWPVRTANLDNPDEFRIDLDPQPGRDFSDAVTAALALREVMAEVGLAAYAKTSGNRGVHVYARITPTHEFQDVRHGVIGVARELERRMPDLVTTSWWKEERGERVFVDFNQANRDRTIAGAYSPRPLPGAPVSTPLAWDELPDADPRDLTVWTVPKLLADRPCPWASMDDRPRATSPARWRLWEADLERGLGELNFPPDYPKMPGEPPRVPPSKRKADRPEEDYLAPKAERDAEWGTPIVPPFGPMLAKLVKEFPKADVLFEPKWDGFRTIIWRSGDMVELGSRNSRPMTRYFPELVEAVKDNFPDPCCIDGEIILIDPDSGDRLNFDLLQQRIHPAASRITRLSSEIPASFVAFDLLALGEANYAEKPFPSGASAGEGARRREAPDLPHPGHRRPRAGQAVVRAVRGGGARRRHRQAAGRPVRRGQARHVEDQARAHRRLRGGRLPPLPRRDGRHRLAAARPVHRRRDAQLGRRHRRVPHGAPPRAVRRAAAAGHHVRRPPVGVGRARGRHPGQPRPVLPPDADRRGALALERQEGPVVHAPAPRARGRGALRPHGGRPVPAHRPVRALASGPRAGLVHVRPARGAGQLRPRRRAGADARAAAVRGPVAMHISRRRTWCCSPGRIPARSSRSWSFPACATRLTASAV